MNAKIIRIFTYWSLNYSFMEVHKEVICGSVLVFTPKNFYLRLMSLVSPMIPVSPSVERALSRPSFMPTCSKIVRHSRFSPLLSGRRVCSRSKKSLSSSERSLKTDDTDSPGVLLYCASSGILCYELSRCIINYDP